MRTQPHDRGRQASVRESAGGQIIVLFALSALVIVAMVGLVLDGGDAFAQRRSQQNAADLAATAGANAYLNTSGNAATRTSAAVTAAHAAAIRNGYAHGVGGDLVTVDTSLLSAGATVRVGISSPHTNNFARVIPGMGTWTVSVTASAISGAIDTAVGAAPWIMHIDAFNSDGSPKYTSANPQDFGEVNGDYPEGALDIAWTDFNGSNNVNTSEVRAIIDGSNVITATMAFNQYIGQHNNGNHTALYGEVDSHLAGHDVPIPIVGPCPSPNQANEGCFKGWAMFHVISASGGSNKDIRGYFLDDFVRQPLTVGECTAAMQSAGTCGLITPNVFGQYAVRLSD
jgi:Flp pilus assembly protein TadG